MAKKFSGFSWEDYERLVSDLPKAVRTLKTLDLEISKAYGKTAAISRLAEKARVAAEVFKGRLHSLAESEHPDVPKEVMRRVFYGSEDQNNTR